MEVLDHNIVVKKNGFYFLKVSKEIAEKIIADGFSSNKWVI